MKVKRWVQVLIGVVLLAEARTEKLAPLSNTALELRSDGR